jgi:hypothetical protein
MNILTELKRPFDPKLVKWRVGATSQDKSKGIALAYIDSRDVMKRLDEVCGIDGWQAKYVPIQDGFICELSIKVGDTWVTKSNAAGYTKVEPIKGGASDALKRSAVLFGVGRYLYYMPNTWVKLKQQGKTHVLAETPKLPKWATPEGYDESTVEKIADQSSGMDSEEMYTVSDVDTSEDRLKAIANASSR